MSVLSTITSGTAAQPPRLMIYGQEGIGKSTFAASAPGVVFIQTEDGLTRINAAKFPLATDLSTVFQQLEALAKEAHTFQTVAVDSLDWLERLIFDRVCADFGGARSIEKVDGGYGKGYTYALQYWRAFLGLLDKCRARGMAVILLAHSKIERFEDPEHAAYDRYAPRLHKLSSALVTEWSDAVLFAARKMRVSASDDGKRAVAAPVGKDGGERILRAIGGPACVAKNRYNMPNEMPLDFGAVVNFIQ